MTATSHGALGSFAAALASSSIHVVDLTLTLSSALPTIKLASHYGQARPGRHLTAVMQGCKKTAPVLLPEFIA